MKYLHLLPFLAALLTAPFASAITLVTPGVPVLNNFASAPAAADISTSSAAIAGGAGDITTAAGLDADINANAAVTSANLASALPTSASSPPTQNAVGRYNTTHQFLQTRPTGGRYAIIMATVTNGTGISLSSLTIAYDYSTVSNVDGTPTGAGGDEEIDGLRVYYSLSGNQGTWINIPSLSADSGFTSGRINAPEAVSATIDLSSTPWASGTNLYVIWVDDNGSPAADANGATNERSFHIDNLSFTGIPEPTSLLMLGLGLLVPLRRKR